nr:amidohydrolase family protein [Haliscomenobacter sp.]
MAISRLNGQNAENYLIVPARIFDGQTIHEAWAVLVEKGKIKAVGPLAQLVIPNPVKRLNLPGTTLLPGLIEGHSHLLLHPYNETSWNDQVLVESEAERVVRATIHARKTIEAGFTTVRDLGSEGQDTPMWV